ncbi:HutG N-formylglutamate amidohydrolase [Rhabdaerophilaceae bacterium]
MVKMRCTAPKLPRTASGRNEDGPSLCCHDCPQVHPVSEPVVKALMVLPQIETTETYTLVRPGAIKEGSSPPVLISSPHSGEQFPAEFLARSQLSRQTLRRASDLFLDRLVLPAVDFGASVLHAHLPRSYVDLNREPLELDPRLISGAIPVEANTRSLRVAGGLGTVPRVIGDQIEIYAGKLGLEEVLERIERAYIPYHRCLNGIMTETRAAHGYVCLIDCHSMPSAARSGSGAGVADFVIGDRFGSSSDPVFVALFEGLARAQGFSVERNQPYAGGYITECYGRPSLGWHAFQIEINRALYMNEATLEPHGGFEAFASSFVRMLEDFFAAEAFEIRKAGLQFHQKAAE